MYIADNTLCRINIMGSTDLAKAERLIQNNSGTTSFITPKIYDSCQIFSMQFLPVSLF